MNVTTPAFIVDEAALAANAQRLAEVKARTGCKILMALKAFSMPAAFHVFRGALDGTCASSVHEARLGFEQFGGETHAFAAAFSERDMRRLLGLEPAPYDAPIIQHITLNSFAQWTQLKKLLPLCKREITCGLRVNPQHSEGESEIYDPCAPKSRLGMCRDAFELHSLDGLTGLHVHNLCEQNAAPFVRTLAALEDRFGDIMCGMRWFNFGGGHHITRGDYDVDLLCNTLIDFKARYPGATIYLEPGEACALNAGTLTATVLDVVWNDMPIAILDASCACHTPDVMEMPYRPRVFRESAPDDRGAEPWQKPHAYRLAGPSCLAGDIFGDYAFDAPLKPGDRIVFEDMAHYTMVKTNTFNGINLPDIFLRQTSGRLERVRTFGYEDFMGRL